MCFYRTIGKIPFAHDKKAVIFPEDKKLVEKENGDKKWKMLKYR